MRPARVLTICAAACVLIAGAGAAISSVIGAHPPARQQDYRRPGVVPYPAANPYSAAKARLGQLLFFDPVLSGSRTRSCASCHNPGLSWGDGQARAVGENQQALPLRTPTLLNVAWAPLLGWDGHFRNLESVAMGPITAAGNMNLSPAELVPRLAAIPGYAGAFRAAFGSTEITVAKVEMALATYERSIVSGEAPFDRWIRGDRSAIGEGARRGFALFNGKAHCAACHSGWAFTDESFHDIGSARDTDIGRGRLFPTSTALRYAFKTPTLRDVARRAPYMHDGSVATLDAVVELYNRGGVERPSRDPEIKPLGLSAAEKADLVAFLGTLTAAPVAVAVPILPR